MQQQKYETKRKMWREREDCPNSFFVYDMERMVRCGVTEVFESVCVVHHVRSLMYSGLLMCAAAPLREWM